MADYDLLETGRQSAEYERFKSLTWAINETYSYANQTMYVTLVPEFLRGYAQHYVAVACKWMDGYVSSIHGAGTEIISTRIASKLITGLTKQICGEKLIFRVNDRKSDTHSTLHFVSKWADEQNIRKAVFSGIGFALACGTSAIKINMSNDSKYWWEAVRMDSCFFFTNAKGEVEEATFMLRSYADTRENSNGAQFVVVERRYYQTREKADIIKRMDGTLEVIHKKGEREPMVVFEVQWAEGRAETSVNSPMSRKIGWDELPKRIREMIRRDYCAVRIGEPQRLTLRNLGVETLLNGETDLSVPTAPAFGESMIVGIQSDLLTYELAESYRIRDMYLGKGSVYVPKSLTLNGDIASSQGNLSGIGDSPVTMLSGVSPEDQSVIVNQFALRGAEWEQIKEDALKGIAVKWGMSPKILASFITNNGSQMTATQIDSEDDSCIAFIQHTRSYFRGALNRLLDTTLAACGQVNDVTLDFASPSLINKDRILDRMTKELDAGLIDVEEAVRSLYPDLDEEELKRRVDVAIAERQKAKNRQMAMDAEEEGYDFTGTTEL